jgi:hypothetical protein
MTFNGKFKVNFNTIIIVKCHEDNNLIMIVL